MELKTFTDPEGYTMKLAVFNGVPCTPAPGIVERMTSLKDLIGRDDDIFILAYPKSGTHWIWEITGMLQRKSVEHIVGEKGQEFLETADQDALKSLPSPRLLNTHIRPQCLPQDLIKRRCRIIYVQRNPKDVMVSFYNHCKGLVYYYKYSGNFSGFFELAMKGEIEAGSWFDYTVAYEEFFREHPDIPVLKLHYEDMKQNLEENVRKISQFCDFPVEEEMYSAIADACTFHNMKSFKVETCDPERQKRWKDGKYQMYRKGVAGDWKNWFTISQNERFDEVMDNRLKGTSISIKWGD